MSWRTVVISSRSKLDFKMNYMIIRKDFETTKIYIDEIYMLVIESRGCNRMRFYRILVAVPLKYKKYQEN